MNENVRKLNENPVTAISTSDYILACDASGTLRCVSLGNLLGSIPVGGRNLVKNSGTVVDTTSYLVSTLYFGDSPLKDGETFTLSVWGDFPSSDSYMNVFNLQGHLYCGSVHKLSSNLMRKSLVWKHVDGTEYINSVSLFQPNQSDTKQYRIDRVMVERGLVAHDWTPAPEDLRGGVIGYYTITCTPREKGGRHERFGGYGAERFDSSFGCLDSIGYGNSSFKRRVFGFSKASGSVCFNVSPKSGKQSNHNLGFRKLHSRRMDNILKKTYGLVDSSTFLLCSQRYFSPTRDNIGYTSARGLYGENYPKGNTRQFITKDCGETDCHNDRGRASNLGYSVIHITNRKEAVAA